MIIDSVEQYLGLYVLGKFTTKVSNIEYRVSNQIQVSINILGIRYRTSTSQGRIAVSADVVIFRGISFSLALSCCSVSTVLNPVPLANLKRFQPIATDI